MEVVVHGAGMAAHGAAALAAAARMVAAQGRAMVAAMVAAMVVAVAAVMAAVMAARLPTTSSSSSHIIASLRTTCLSTHVAVMDRAAMVVALHPTLACTALTVHRGH